MRNSTANISLLVVVAFCLTLSISLPGLAEENWPAWRGPRGDSVSQSTNLPIAWNENSGVVWKAKIPAWGTSTPVIWGERIFLTTQSEKNLIVLCLDKATGRTLWKHTVGSGIAARTATYGKAKFHRIHNLASPSPVTDGKTVVFHFGNGLLAAYDFSGKQLWKQNLTDQFGRYSIWWGHANSPVIVGPLVISVCMQDAMAKEGQPQAKSYLVAHNLLTGKQRWLTPRQTKAPGEQADSYTTPLLWKNGDRTELVVMGANWLDAYDPATGKQTWHLPALIGGRTITGPTAAHGRIYTTRGMRGPLLAIKPSQTGLLSRDDILWRYDQGTPDTCCPVVWANLLFTITDNGIVRCFDAHNGQLQWKERLAGSYKASPLAADGRIYFLNTKGLCTVVSASTRFDKLTENQLDEETIASPAVSGKQLFIRGKNHLYCLGL